MKWTGTWPQPEQYSLKARFVNLGVNAVGRLPGFAGVSGNIDGNERGGTLNLNTQNAAVELPLVFRDKLTFDTLTAQVGWQRSGEQYELKLNNISFSNPDLAGSVSGTYQTVADSRGVIDLTGSATRADAQQRRALSAVADRGARARTGSSARFSRGSSNDVKVRLKGNLDDFPFPDDKSGVFQVTARVSGGVLDYAPGLAENREYRRRFEFSRQAHGSAGAHGHHHSAPNCPRCALNCRTSTRRTAC